MCVAATSFKNAREKNTVRSWAGCEADRRGKRYIEQLDDEVDPIGVVSSRRRD